MKNLIVASVVGLAFMGGGFFVGNMLAPKPKPPAPVAVAAPASTSVLPAPNQPISMDVLRKASESMMSLNSALQVREQAIAAREAKDKRYEDELEGERAAMIRSHDKFQELYVEFQKRLQLVDANEQQRLEQQSEIFNAMDQAQAIDLIRSMEDPELIRLFSVMDVKPLANLVAGWRTKYPNDTPRLLHALDAMSQVMPKEKIAMVDPISPTDLAAPAPIQNLNPSAPTPADSSSTPAPDASGATPAPATDGSTPAPAGDNSATPAPTDGSAPAPAPSTDGSTPAAPLAPPADGAGTTPATSTQPDAAPAADPSTNPAVTPSQTPATADSTPTSSNPVSTATNN